VGTAKNVEIANGLFSVRVDTSPDQVKKTDLIIIPAIGWDITAAISANEHLLPWIVEQYKRGAEIASTCIGGFLLASSGLLNGRSCSTHWLAADNFRKLFPEVNLTVDKIITDEHGIYTNGGAFSFVNLLLYLIEKYSDRETAIYCSKIFQVDIDRHSQSTFIMFKGLKDHHDKEIKMAQLFIENNIDKKVSMEELASNLGVGRRNFDRRFIKATYNSPVEYLQRVKIEAAKKTLETSRKTINEVMYEVGYSDVKAFREVFKKITGLSPIDYRNKYNKETVLL
jgi:transcriptional regulator GlxA family with amidase domain